MACIMTTIACASDIHGKYMNPTVHWPPADILVLAGDILYDAEQIAELGRLNEFFKQKKKDGVYKKVVMVAGNHDFIFQRLSSARKQLKDIIYLQDEEAIIEGLKFYGSPWQSWFWDWAFNFPNPSHNPEKAIWVAQECWQKIPDDTDVLVTHGPPRGILDKVPSGLNVGCEELKNRLEHLDLKMHIFGHIHYGYGTKEIDGTRFVNAAVCGEDYRPDNPIKVFEV